MYSRVACSVLSCTDDGDYQPPKRVCKGNTLAIPPAPAPSNSPRSNPETPEANAALCLVYNHRAPWFRKLVRPPTSVRFRAPFYSDQHSSVLFPNGHFQLTQACNGAYARATSVQFNKPRGRLRHCAPPKIVRQNTAHWKGGP